jgi:hypothetical protein
MPDVLLMILGMVFSIITVAIIVPFPGDTLSQWLKRAWIAIFPIAIWTWLIVAYNQPWSYTWEETSPLETVEWLNGNRIQIVSLNPVNKVNLTEKFKQVFAEDSQVIIKKRDRWHCGVYLLMEHEFEYHVVPKLQVEAGK